MRVTPGSCLAAVGGGTIGLIVGGSFGVIFARAIDGPATQIGDLSFSFPSTASMIAFSICALIGTVVGVVIGGSLGAADWK
jgi:membrane-associated phospholipid phosphatase